jgi:hypothetical protein
VDRPNTILDYSSTADEQRREREAEDKRREALELYNESTFGERRPIASTFLRLAAVAVLACLIVLFLPRRLARPLGSLAIVAFVLWEMRRRG